MNRYRSGRVHPRLVVFFAIIVAPVAWLTYTLISFSATGGVQRADGVVEVDLRALGHITFNNMSGTLADIPARYRALEGKRVLLTGYMVSPETPGEKIRKFEFLYDRNIGAFGGLPTVPDRVLGTCLGQNTVLYEYGPLMKLTGVFHLKINRDPKSGRIVSIYQLDVEDVERA